MSKRHAPLTAPSILSSDLARLCDYVSAVLDAVADVGNFELMDTNDVPNRNFGPAICKALRNYGVTATIDAHLMVSPVDSLIGDFAEAGADWISFHPEASHHVDRSLQLIRSAGCKAGLVLNPATPVAVLDYVMDRLDFVLVMSVNPGFGGQSFIPSALDKLATIRSKIDDSGLDIRLEIDGGVKVENIGEIAAAGADTFVAGSAIFGKGDYTDTIAAMREQIAAA
ncbi:ribulose-phosphate 3-epimerase [bacterium]|nr:ribulose-phosphate 3-epimerase [bacterium]